MTTLATATNAISTGPHKIPQYGGVVPEFPEVHPMTYVEVRHNFETAHRLPHLEGKCQSLHGHSWWATITIRNMRRSNGVAENGIAVEFGLVKSMVRCWIDKYLDHGVMLGAGDQLVELLRNEGKTKLFIFGEDTPNTLAWPTVENVATMLHNRVQAMLDEQSWQLDVCKVVRVKVQETAVNCAITGWMD